VRAPVAGETEKLLKADKFGKKAAANADDLRRQSGANSLAPVSTRLMNRIDYLTNSNFCRRKVDVCDLFPFCN